MPNPGRLVAGSRVPLLSNQLVILVSKDAKAPIVYVTDARTRAEVRIAYTVAIGKGPAIVYPAAVLMGPRQAEAFRFEACLRTPEARSVFENAGFRVFARR